MAFKITPLDAPSGRHLNPSNAIFVFVYVLLAVSMSLLTSSSTAAQTVSSPTETNEIDGSGIINTPNHNSSSPLHNIPFVMSRSESPLAIGRMCEHDSDCGNFSICRLVLSDRENTKKICECDNKEMKQVRNACYIKPGHQCYYPNKNSHGYAFVQCFPGSVCKTSVNKSAPHNGYCMCRIPSVEDHYRSVDVDAEMARCSAAFISVLTVTHSVAAGSFLLGTIAVGVHNIVQSFFCF